MTDKVRAKVLWNGERFTLVPGGPVYVIKTYKQTGSGGLTARSERRVTCMSGGFCGIGKSWKRWEELKTPIEAQDLEEEVVKLTN